jgi:hypothetical protein
MENYKDYLKRLEALSKNEATAKEAQELKKQLVEMEAVYAELQNFYFIHQSLIQNFKGVDNQFKIWLNKDNFNADAIRSLLPKLEKTVESLAALNYELFNLGNTQYVPTYQTQIDNQYTYITSKMTILEVEPALSKFQKLLESNENALPIFLEEKRNTEQEQQKEQQRRNAENELRRKQEYEQDLLRQEETIWLKIRNSQSLKDFEGYLIKYPLGRYAGQARTMIITIEQNLATQKYMEEQEIAYWQRCLENNTIEWYQSYTTQFPQGLFVEDAKLIICKLDWYNLPLENSLEVAISKVEEENPDFIEYFEDNRNNWFTGHCVITNANYEIVNNQYRIEQFGNQGFQVYCSQKFNLQNDFLIGVSLERLYGVTNYSYGIALFRKGNSCIHFGISIEGYFWIYRIRDNIYEEISNWKSSNAIIRNNYANSNELFIIKRKNELGFFINLEFVYSTVIPNTDANEIGFFTNNNISVAINSFFFHEL